MFWPLTEFGGDMKLEIHAKRGPLKVHVQMGTPAEALAEPLRHFLQPDTLNRVINLWANADHCREFEEDEDGRTLIIRDCA